MTRPHRAFWRVVLLLLVLSAPAWARTYHVSKFISNIQVKEDGSARITEQINFVFNGEYHGIYRDIPVDYPGPNGTNYSLFLKVNSITGSDGAPLKYEKHTSDHYLKLKVYVPDAVDASRTVNIEYSALVKLTIHCPCILG